VLCPALRDVWQLADELMPVSERTKQWLAEFKARHEPKDDTNIKPITAALAEDLATLVGTRHMTLYTALRKAVKSGYLGIVVARQVMDRFSRVDHPDWDGFVAVVNNDDVHWDVVKKVTPVTDRDVFDFAIPSTKVFMISNGLIVYDTMQIHVPASDDAVKNAVEKMLPSTMLLSPLDFKSPMFKPEQEYIAGLWEATSKKKKVPPVVFRNEADAVAALRRGEVGWDTPIQIIEGSGK
jgi:hypothetical protein